MANELAAAQQQYSLIATMAHKYGLEPKAFENTIRRTVMPANHTNEEFCAFCIVANRYTLNPLIREIYAFPKKGGGIQAIVGVDGWISLVNRQENFDGVEFADQVKDGKLEAVTCTMYRKDRTRPIIAKEYLNECRRDTDPWRQMPYRMLRHKAYMQAARMAFGFSGLQDEDDAERAIEMTPDGYIAPDTSVGKLDVSKLKAIENPERRSSNDDHFAEAANSAPSMAATPAANPSTPAANPSTTPAANPEAPASAETKGKRGRPAGSKNAPKVMPTPVPGSTPADKPDAAPAPQAAASTKAAPPGVAPTTESQEVDEPGSHEADEPQDMPDAGAKAADNAQHDDLDDFDADSAENEEADKPIIRSMKFNTAKADTSNPAKPFYKLISDKNEIVGTHDLATVQKVAQLAMDKDESKRIVASYTIDVLLAKDGDKLILLGLAPGAVRKP